MTTETLNKLPVYGDPEQFLNPVFIGENDQNAYDQMLFELGFEEILITDTESVGKSALMLFQQQEEIEKQCENMIRQYPHIPETIEAMDYAKRLKADFEILLKSKYNLKSILMNQLSPEDRQELSIKRKNEKAFEKDYPECKEYKNLLKAIDKVQKLIDEDVSGLDVFRNYLALVQIGTFSGNQYLIDPKILDERFNELMRSRKCIVGMNLKFDMMMFDRHLGLFFDDVDTVCYDIMLAAKMAHSGHFRSFSLQSLAEYYLNYYQSKEERVTNWLRRPLKPEQIKYAALDGVTPGMIFLNLVKELREDSTGSLVECAKLQMDFLKVLTRMQLDGLYIDLEATKRLDAEIDLKLGQVIGVLGVILEDPGLEYTQCLRSPTKTLERLKEFGVKYGIQCLIDLASTSAKEFQSFEDPVYLPEEVLNRAIQYTIENGIPPENWMSNPETDQASLLAIVTNLRSLSHTKKTYCDAIFTKNVDSRIHSNFIQLQVEGTRMSSKEPNVQNVSQPGRWDPSKEPFEEAVAKWHPGKKTRTLYIPTPGKKLYDADYGQIELCMIAFYSQDATMLKALTDGVDLHALTANTLFHLGYSYEDLLNKATLKEFKLKYGRERQIAKVFNFAVAYGAGKVKLRFQLYEADIYDLSLDEIQLLKDAWLDMFPGVRTWQDNILSMAKHSGFCVTRMGRTIYFQEPAKVYSKAFNTPIQASCYEGLQRASVIFNRKVQKLCMQGIIPYGSIRLVNLIHDEKMVEADENIAEESVIKLITESMIEGIAPLMSEEEFEGKVYQMVPVRVDCSRVERWSDKA